ncbi:helix-turn-helix transcriptional regulator [Sinorhizobium terangae]|uniref:Helix-turn-helix transcriptional regulator n=1 Tax=Sinorhizobium terangae TaxID=110322 RepID=A0A6N7LD76_SINTE|nr:response regulator transcription factor [Sinorhizobium terangae]MBB4183795.1 DNA-binding CsgD family transcriptional regulator [Sinorhizobium terangae]MQX15178.1 helix-turn-helix transcriptional regulator [Sinorhizobium terangae]WFU47937.1 response regulator transcription factor [Sinorhizobium terangae]
MDWTRGRGRTILVAGAVSAFALLLGLEVVKEEEELTVTELLTEAVSIALLVGCSACVALLSSRLREQEAESFGLRDEVARIRARDAQWRADLADHFQELGAAIQRQFAAWGCTQAEQEVGLLLLKGFSHKEIARFRGASEATIRQQATAVYHKAELSGRAALSAYFLEELLMPPGQTSQPPARGDSRARAEMSEATDRILRAERGTSAP